MSAISSLIFDGTLDRFPDLRVVFAGFGVGWVPPLGWRMDSEWRGLRIEVPWLTRAPSQVIGDQIRFIVDAAVERDASTWLLAGMLPPACLVWGSDPRSPAPAQTRWPTAATSCASASSEPTRSMRSGA